MIDEGGGAPAGRAGHFEVQAGFDCEVGGICAVPKREVKYRGRMKRGGLPITYDDAFESPFFAENLVQQPGILGAMYTANAPIPTHITYVSVHKLPESVQQGWSGEGE